VKSCIRAVYTVSWSGHVKILHIDKQHKARTHFFIRTDLLSLCNITQTQDSSGLNDAPESFQHSIFKNRYSSRTLHSSVISIKNSQYKIFILNDEFTDLAVEVDKFITRKLNSPSLIKIKCSNIKKQIHNNECTNDFEIIKPIYSRNPGSHYFHKFEIPIFIPLLTNTLNTLKFDITNEFDEPLDLHAGAPTVLSMTFAKMSRDFNNFHCFVSPSSEFPENTVSNFTTSLQNPLILNNSWFVGLRDITFPNSFKNLTSDDNEVIISIINGDETVERLHIRIPNIKANSTSFVKYINSRIALMKPNICKLELNVDGYVLIISHVTLQMFLTPQLAYVLGFVHTSQSLDTPFWVSDKLVDDDFFRARFKMNVENI